MQQQPDRYRQLEMVPRRVPRIAQGGGLSYVAASFAEGVVAQRMTSFNRILALSGESFLKVEAGITLAKLTTFLSHRGRHLPVLPGHPCITVGGCIAADAHGKNPSRDGTFCDWVEAMTLFHPDYGFREITRDVEPGLFELTCGGLGLTGIIVDATLRVVPVQGETLRVTKSRCVSLGHAVDLLDGIGEREYAYSWHDGSARGPSFGRGLVVTGEWVGSAASGRVHLDCPMQGEHRVLLPFSLWTKRSTRVVNATYRRLAEWRSEAIEPRTKAFFPLAGTPNYFRAFGRRGVIEIQLLIRSNAFAAFERELRNLVGRTDPTLVLMSLKRFHGRQRGCTLSGDGILIAFNLPRDDSADTVKFLNELDALAVDVQAQPNIMKDGRISERTAHRSLPNHASFAARLAEHDRDRFYRSALSQRLGL